MPTGLCENRYILKIGANILLFANNEPDLIYVSDNRCIKANFAPDIICRIK